LAFCLLLKMAELRRTTGSQNQQFADKINGLKGNMYRDESDVVLCMKYSNNCFSLYAMLVKSFV